jgi:hypothetical protein
MMDATCPTPAQGRAAKGNMLTTHFIEKYLERFPPGLHDIVWELRSIIASVAPNAAEVARRNYLSYFHEQRGGPVSAGICQIGFHPDHIRLAFIHGAFLPDPKHLLEGDQHYKRFVRIDSFEHAPWEDLKSLVAASSSFDPYTLSAQEIAAIRHQK